MHQKFGEKIKREIRRRAFERSDRLRQESQNLQSVKHTLEALHEVTGLPRAQLNAIANETRLSFEVHSEQFFSIKNQILIVSVACGCLVFFAWLLFLI